jgi:CBS domain-containing protein
LGPSIGDRGRRVDLMRDVVQPIVDVARMYTLARGGTELPTGERLAAAAVDGALSPGLATTLVEGHRLLTWTRLGAHFTAGPDADDRVGWTVLPRPLRARFGETFGAIRAAQEALRTSHHLIAGT